MIVAFVELVNCTATEAVAPGAKLLAPGTVRYELPLNVPVAFASSTPLVNDVKTIWKGPLNVLVLMFVIVTVPSKVLLTRLYAKPEAVVAT